MLRSKWRFYSNTSSARARKDSAIGSSRAFAVFEVDDELEFIRLLDRNIAGLLPPQYLIDKIGGATELIGPAWTIGHQAACFDLDADIMHGWQACRERPVI